MRQGSAGLCARLGLPPRRLRSRLLGVHAGAACRRRHRHGQPRLCAGRPQGRRIARRRTGFGTGRDRRRPALARHAGTGSRRTTTPRIISGSRATRTPSPPPRGSAPWRRSTSSRRRRCRRAACRSPASSWSTCRDNHLQYAITWYGLAAALVGVFVVWRTSASRTSRGTGAKGGRPARVPCEGGRFSYYCAPYSVPAAHGASPARISAQNQDRLMQHVSTRGEAPPLGFAEAMLAGLARDGGLYVPQSWPRLEPASDRRLSPAAPMPKSRSRSSGRFVGDAIAEADLARMAREAYGTFRHPAVAPLTQLGANTFALELFHGPTLGVQGPGDAAAGAADGSRAGRARRAPHHRGRDLGRYRRRRGRGVPRPRARSISSCCFRKAAFPTCSGA